MESDYEKFLSAVRTPDPQYVKPIPDGSGLKTVDAQYINRLVTGLLGPQGRDWGLRDFHSEVVPTRSRSGSRSKGYQYQETHTYLATATFYHPWGEFPIQVDMEFWSGQDVAKKARTALLNKALSQIGVAEDLYIGLFDDDAYIHQAAFKHLDAEQQRERIATKIAGCSTAEQLEVVAKNIKTYLANQSISQEQADELTALARQRISDMSGRRARVI